MEYQARRPLDEEYPEGHRESDKDYMINNMELAVMLLDLYARILDTDD